MTTLIKIFIIITTLLPLSLFASEITGEIPKVPNVIGAGNVLQIVMGLFVVLVIIIGTGWLLKRYGGMGGVSNANLKVVAGITVGQREKIVVVQAGDVQVLVGVSPGNIRALHVLDKNIDTENQLKVGNTTVEKSSSGFVNHLKQQIKNREES